MLSTTHTMHIPFDTLAYAKKLKQAGVSEDIAEVHAEALAEVVSDQLATKKDLGDLETRINSKFAEIKHKIERSNYKLIISLGSMLAAGIAILGILIKLH